MARLVCGPRRDVTSPVIQSVLVAATLLNQKHDCVAKEVRSPHWLYNGLRQELHLSFASL